MLCNYPVHIDKVLHEVTNYQTKDIKADQEN